MTRKEWLLAAVAVARGEPLTPIQLQKVLFLVGKRVPGGTGSKFYKFQPYNYGPFSAQIYRDAEELSDEGLIRIDRAEPGRPWAVYSATPRALDEAVHLRNEAGDEAWAYLTKLVEWARSLSFQQLVSSVYEAYPEQRVNSIFVA